MANGNPELTIKTTIQADTTGAVVATRALEAETAAALETSAALESVGEVTKVNALHTENLGGILNDVFQRATRTKTGMTDLLSVITEVESGRRVSIERLGFLLEGLGTGPWVAAFAVGLPLIIQLYEHFEKASEGAKHLKDPLDKAGEAMHALKEVIKQDVTDLEGPIADLKNKLASITKKDSGEEKAGEDEFNRVEKVTKALNAQALAELNLREQKALSAAAPGDRDAIRDQFTKDRITLTSNQSNAEVLAKQALNDFQQKETAKQLQDQKAALAEAQQKLAQSQSTTSDLVEHAEMISTPENVQFDANGKLISESFQGKYDKATGEGTGLAKNQADQETVLEDISKQNEIFDRYQRLKTLARAKGGKSNLSPGDQKILDAAKKALAQDDRILQELKDDADILAKAQAAIDAQPKTEKSLNEDITKAQDAIGKLEEKQKDLTADRQVITIEGDTKKTEAQTRLSQVQETEADKARKKADADAKARIQARITNDETALEQSGLSPGQQEALETRLSQDQASKLREEEAEKERDHNLTPAEKAAIDAEVKKTLAQGVHKNFETAQKAEKASERDEKTEAEPLLRTASDVLKEAAKQVNDPTLLAVQNVSKGAQDLHASIANMMQFFSRAQLELSAQHTQTANFINQQIAQLRSEFENLKDRHENSRAVTN